MCLDGLAVSCALIVPLPSSDSLVGFLRLVVIYQTIALERACGRGPSIFGCVPRVHQQHAKRQFLVCHDIIEHLLYMPELSVLISLQGADSPVNDPVAIALA